MGIWDKITTVATTSWTVINEITAPTWEKISTITSPSWDVVSGITTPTWESVTVSNPITYIESSGVTPDIDGLNHWNNINENFEVFSFKWNQLV